MLITPHAGEFARVAELTDDRVDSARRAAADLGVTVLLKGNATVVAAPDGRVLVHPAGSAWLATAGSGDVLSGVAGALLAAGLEPWWAGGCAAFVHARAAEIGAGADVGPGVAGPRVARPGRPADGDPPQVRRGTRMTTTTGRPRVEAHVDLDALAHNVDLLAGLARRSGAATMAVVKADGYGHGAVDVAPHRAGERRHVARRLHPRRGRRAARRRHRRPGALLAAPARRGLRPRGGRPASTSGSRRARSSTASSPGRAAPAGPPASTSRSTPG